MAGAVHAAGQLGGGKEIGISTRKVIGFVLTIAVPALLWFAPLNFESASKHAFAVAAFMIVTWIAEPIPHALTGLIGCYLFWVLKVVKFEVAFSGFADQTAWFLFGAGLFGMMATKTGLARRLAYLIIQRIGASSSRLLLGIILSSFLLTFLVPSGIPCQEYLGTVQLGTLTLFGFGPDSNSPRNI